MHARTRRALAGVVLGGAAAALGTQGCQDPTEVTLDLRLATAQCNEIHATAVTVGVEPTDTEDRIKSRYPTAQTQACDVSTRKIGTLVVTPSDADRASVVVVTAYGDRRDPTDCQPPDYAGCIVARRRFSFARHKPLFLPITIDPTCVNVPCDAFSTCRKGICFSSESAPCDNDGCADGEPGSLPDGGTDPTKAVDGGPSDAQAKKPPSCNGTTLVCGDAPCPAPARCCMVNGSAVCDLSGATCPLAQACCTSTDCSGGSCAHTAGTQTMNNQTPDATAGGDDAALPPPDAESDAFVPPPIDGGTTFDGGPDFDAGTGTDSGTNTFDGGVATDGGASGALGVCAP